MLIDILLWVAFLAALAVAYYVLRFFFDLRSTSTQIIAIALDDFFDAADSIMETPDELPESILKAIKTMVASMNNGHGSRALLKIVREANENDANLNDNEFSSQVDSLRPELKELFLKLTLSWLRFVSNRHVFYQIAISAEMRKREIRKKTVTSDDRETAIAMLNRFSGPSAAC